MRTYIIRRLLLTIPTLWIASLLVFFSIRIIPGDIIDLMASEMTYFTTTDRAEIEARMGFDVPSYVQYFRWIGVIRDHNGEFNGLLQGNLGVSLWRNSPVTEEISARWPVTLELGVLALIIAQIIALPIGILSAIRQDSAGDYIGRSFAILCIAVPNFWLGTMVIVFPAIWWGWSPPIMLIRFLEDPVGNIQQYLVPAIVLGITPPKAEIPPTS